MTPASGSSDTPPITDKKMWRKLKMRAHPDSGGSEELFTWLSMVEEAVTGNGHARPGGGYPPFDSAWSSIFADIMRERAQSPFGGGGGGDFDERRRRAEGMWDAKYPPNPNEKFEEDVKSLGVDVYRSCLMPLIGRPSMYPHTDKSKPATGKQVARLAHEVGMTGQERAGFYKVAERLKLKRNAVSWLIDYWKKGT